MGHLKNPVLKELSESCLPVLQYEDEIVTALTNDSCDTLIVVGETGSGKSTRRSNLA